MPCIAGKLIKQAIMIKILLADDHSIVRSGVKNLLTEHIMDLKVDEAGDGYEATELIKMHHYDLVLLDINMPEVDVLSLIPWIHAVNAACKVLVFTTYPAKTYGVRSLQSGAYGYLSKTASNEEIIRAINTVLNGKRYISTELSDLMVGQIQGKDNADLLNLLSAREMEISRLLQQGNSLPEIGKQLNIGYTTVVTYKNRIFKKLQINNILSLARLMQEHGFRDPI
jgi:two-component system invasion response regulator UvrY